MFFNNASTLKYMSEGESTTLSSTLSYGKYLCDIFWIINFEIKSCHIKMRTTIMWTLDGKKKYWAILLEILS